MRILLGISALVLVAILWTAFSISRHISLTRRRNRFLREQQLLAHDADLGDEPFAPAVAPPPPAVVPLPARFAAPAALPAKLVADQALAASPAVEVQISKPVEATPPAPSFPGFAQREIKQGPTPPPLPQPQPQQAAAQPLRIMEFIPGPPPATAPAALRRPVRSVPPPPRVAAVATGRPAWDYFNKDMGDLSDPTPSRIRDRVRPR